MDNLVRVFALVRECMSPRAVAFVNIGDTYQSKGGTTSRVCSGKQLTNAHSREVERPYAGESGNLCLIPQRLALALQADGWIVRSVIVWHKPSAMPASLSGWVWRRHRVKVKGKDTAHMKDWRGPGGNPMRPHSGETMHTATEWADCPGCKLCEKNAGLVLRRGSWRPTSSWEPVLMLAKTDRYYADGIAVQTPPAPATVSRDRYSRVLDDPDEQYAVAHDHETVCDGGANLRDVWRSTLADMTRQELEEMLLDLAGGGMTDTLTVSAEPLRQAHYAAFPTRLVSYCLRSGTSARGYCARCGSPWCRVVETSGGSIGQGSWVDHSEDAERGVGHNRRGVLPNGQESAKTYRRETLDWRPSCSCAAGESRPGRVLDCFAGSGRTGLEARRLGLDFTGIELNESYCELARKLLRDDAPLFFEDSP